MIVCMLLLAEAISDASLNSFPLANALLMLEVKRNTHTDTVIMRRTASTWSPRAPFEAGLS